MDFNNKASSKRGLLRVSRGYLGNALKCMFGYSYSLAVSVGLDPPDIIVSSGDHEYRISLLPDRVAGVIKSNVITTKRADNGLTTFTLRFPKKTARCDLSVLKDIIFATSMVNPNRRISYNLLDESGILGSPGEREVVKQKTAAQWYTIKQLESLFEDFIRIRPGTQLKEFIPIFRGLTGKKVIREILHELNNANHDSSRKVDMQFLPATQIRELTNYMIRQLFVIMKAKTMPISKRSIPSVLGVVGEESFKKVCKERGWERLKYTLMTAFRIDCPKYYHNDDDICPNPDHVEFPYIIEIAIFDRNNDEEGLKVYQCVNFMASMEDIFSRLFDINYRLGKVGINEDMPVTVIVHLVCPVLYWLNYGKSGLDE